MIYICIPAYNEARTVGVLLWKIRQVMADFPRDYQILVVDDASTDATPEVLAPYARVLPLTVFRHDRRAGYAASLEELLREAVRRAPYPKRDVVVTLQADFTEEPEEIPTLVKKIESGADLVTSSTLELGDSPRSVRWARRLLRPLLRRLRTRGPVGDPLSGFRAYRIICLKKALEGRNGTPLLRREGWAANAELLREVAPYARRVDAAESPVVYYRRYRLSRFEAWDTALEVLRLASGRQVDRIAPEADEPEPEPEPDRADFAPAAEAEAETAVAVATERPKRRRSRPKRRRKKKPGTQGQNGQTETQTDEAEGGPAPAVEASKDGAPAKKRRRRTRGGRRRRGGSRRASADDGSSPTADDVPPSAEGGAPEEPRGSAGEA